MNVKKGIGLFVILVIAILVGITFLVATADTATSQTTLNTAKNVTVTFPTNTTYITLSGKAVSPSDSSANVVATNATGGEIIATGNYTLSNYYNNNGALEARLYGRPTIANSLYAGKSVNLTYTYESTNYVGDNTSRTLITLIVLFGAIGILAVVIVYLWRSDDLQHLMKLGGAKVVSAQ